MASLLAATGLPDLHITSFLFLLASAAIAGFVRGYSGFGFALAAMPLMTAVLVPRDAIPVVLVFEIVLTLQLARGIKQDVAWNTLGWLVVGMAIGTPFGVGLVGLIPPEPMRIALCLILLVAAGLLWRPPSRAVAPTPPLITGTGVVSGVLSGGSAMSGPPVVLLFLATSNDAARSRATMMAFFLCSAAVALTLGLTTSVFPVRAPTLAAVLFPAVVIGATLGARCFVRTNGRNYRRVTLSMITVIGTAALAHSLKLLTDH